MNTTSTAAATGTRNVFDVPSRAGGYLFVSDKMETVRANEIALTLARTAARKGDEILDLGAGHGVLSGQLARGVGRRGRVVAADTSMLLLAAVTGEPSLKQLESRLLTGAELPFADDSFDAVVSLATFHHIDDKALTLSEIARVLRPGGRLVVVDVAEGTAVCRYFDGPVDKMCSTGHRHTYLSEQTTRTLCAQAGLRRRSWTIHDVPWRFSDTDNAGRFLHALHDAVCTPAECYDVADRYIGFRRDGDSLLLSWQLGVLEAYRPNVLGG